MVVPIAMAREADPAVREIADDDADHPGDGDGDQRRGRPGFGEHVIDCLAADRDQRPDDRIADKLGEGGAGLRVGQRPVEMSLHLFSRASTEAFAIAIGFTRAGGISRTAARRTAQARSPPISSGCSSGTRVERIASDSRFSPASLA